MRTTYIFNEPCPSLEELQALVGGYIEVVPLPEKAPIQILVDEEGLLKGLPENFHLSSMLGRRIYGSAVVLVGDSRMS